jgi:hypothetical protein
VDYVIITGYDMKHSADEHGLEFLLAFDGRIHHLEEGYWIKFEIKRIRRTRRRPHGLAYSFTLHRPDGARLVGFDNAHGGQGGGPRIKRRSAATDHWHRAENDPGRPYVFRNAVTLIDDFFDKVERVLRERGIKTTVVRVEEKGKRK